MCTFSESIIVGFGVIDGSGAILPFLGLEIEVNTTEAVWIPVRVSDNEACDDKFSISSVLTICESVIVALGVCGIGMLFVLGVVVGCLIINLIHIGWENEWVLR